MRPNISAIIVDPVNTERKKKVGGGIPKLPVFKKNMYCNF